MDDKKSCLWCVGDPLLKAYHDAEWGVRQLHDDSAHFEFLTLEAMQCGLSWMTVLKKREAMREAFDGFSPEKIALYDEGKVQSLLTFPGIIHSATKLNAMVENARAFLRIQAESGSFDAWFWRFTNGRTLIYPAHRACIPAQNALSQRVSREMKKRGFGFLGPVVIYSHLQAVGMINDHDADCFGFKALGGEVQEADAL